MEDCPSCSCSRRGSKGRLEGYELDLAKLDFERIPHELQTVAGKRKILARFDPPRGENRQSSKSGGGSAIERGR
jgi:hypothetical protein